MMRYTGGGGRLEINRSGNFPALAGQSSRDLAVPNELQSFKRVQSSGYGLRELEGASVAVGVPSKSLYQSQHGFRYSPAHLAQRNSI